jgi:hypothetical protein
MRRLGSGTGFAFAKLSEILPLRERSLASVKMTDWASVDRFGQDDKRKSARYAGNLPLTPSPGGRGTIAWGWASYGQDNARL